MDYWNNLNNVLSQFFDDPDFSKFFIEGLEIYDASNNNFYTRYEFAFKNYLEKTNKLCPFWKAMIDERDKYGSDAYDVRCHNCFGADKNCPYYVGIINAY